MTGTTLTCESCHAEQWAHYGDECACGHVLGKRASQRQLIGLPLMSERGSLPEALTACSSLSGRRVRVSYLTVGEDGDLVEREEVHTLPDLPYPPPLENDDMTRAVDGWLEGEE